jgi:hypothetical protein
MFLLYVHQSVHRFLSLHISTNYGIYVKVHISSSHAVPQYEYTMCNAFANFHVILENITE